jgi:hypothetical protein
MTHFVARFSMERRQLKRVWLPALIHGFPKPEQFSSNVLESYDVLWWQRMGMVVMQSWATFHCEAGGFRSPKFATPDIAGCVF